MNGLPFSTERIRKAGDYDRLRQTFRWHCPEHFNFGFDVVDRWAAALRIIRQFITSPSPKKKRSPSRKSPPLGPPAAPLTELGRKRGRPCAGHPAANRAPGGKTLVGLFKARFRRHPGTTLLTAKDIAYRLDLAQAAAVITDREGAEKIDAITASAPHLRHRVLVADENRPGWHRFDDCWRPKRRRSSDRRRGATSRHWSISPRARRACRRW